MNNYNGPTFILFLFFAQHNIYNQPLELKKKQSTPNRLHDYLIAILQKRMTTNQNTANKLDIENSQQIRNYMLNYQRIRKFKAIQVTTPNTNFYHKQLKKNKLLLDLPNLDKIIDSPPNSKIILVEKEFKLEDLQLSKNPQGLVDTNIKVIEHQLTLNYKCLSTQDLLDLFTGAKIPFPNSFQTVGHLAHYNLTVEQQPYHKVIGQITLLKCLNITCVVNKIQKLHNIYRTPQLEMMAGQKNYFVKLKQVGTLFQFDFEKVYWCSRLQQQRDRLLAQMKTGECLADIFCGCGPLAVRAARKGLFVIANDLNPYGYEYLVHNAQLNKISQKMLCYNMCARAVMKKLYAEKAERAVEFKEPDHIYMNLPVDAIEFLDVFTDYAQDMQTTKLPLIHVNCFVVADSEQKSRQVLAIRIGKVLPGFKEQDILHMNHIKNVTIIMRMYCVTFKVRGKYNLKENVNNNDSDKQVELNANGRKKIKPNQ